jgi:hypothetical protein
MIHTHKCNTCGRLRTCLQTSLTCWKREDKHEWTCSECRRAAEPLEQWLQDKFDRIEAIHAKTS